MGRAPDFQPDSGTWFDLNHYLEDKSLIAKARRAGLRRYIPVGVLASELSRLVEKGILDRKEVDSLLADLRQEGYLDG